MKGKTSKVFWASAALALALVLGVGVQSAQADANLYPAFRTDGSFITFVTWVNKGNAPTFYPWGTPYPASTAASMHWMYRYSTTGKNPTKAAECGHVDGFGKTTLNDIGTVDVSKTINGGAPIGFDTTSTGFLIGKGWKGYLVTYNFSGVYPPGTAGAENTLVGEAVIADTATGEAYSYRAANDPVGTTEGNLDDIGYGAFNGTCPGSAYPCPYTIPTAIWHPVAGVSTTWYVVVTTSDMANLSTSATIQFTGSDGAVTPSGTFYDRNENGISGTVPVTVVCFAYLTLNELLSPAAVPFANNGGWAHVQQTAPAPASADVGILVYKLESTKALKAGVTSSAWTSQNRVDF